ncbi:Xylulose kinase [Tetrabaena socialis]|uniref:glycerol kinase n=1 Tax=Tetrabaena socialis TaxID=47790 RepID=A0A2J7ZQJ6_9CHLO|nr:Xylulose kinase [Tetrabaena socialis]|eukprot:PNH02543.1 Xylulose kinase [Tetrabaena socialis]
MSEASPVVLGIDVGTQGAKAVLYDLSSHAVLAKGSSSNSILPSDVPGRAEQHPATWLQGVREAVAQVLCGLDAARVRGVAVSGQQHGLVVLDAEGQVQRVLRPAKLWCDTESAAEAAELSHTLEWTLVPSFTITKLLWLKRHEPEVFARVACVLLPHDYVNLWLTGRRVMEFGDASGTGFLDVGARRWSEGAMDAVDPRVRAEGMLPPLVGPNEAIGTLLAEVAAELGLPGGILVAPGSGDNACSALGAGLAGDGATVMSLGTSGTLFARSATPILDPTGIICPFCDATGAYLPLLCTLNCTRVLEEVRESFGLEHAELTCLAQSEPPGCSGVTWLPYMIGERTPSWPHATGALLGLRPGCLRPGLLYRAAMEGSTLSLLSGYRRMLAAGLSPCDELRLVGGGANNPLWRQVVADAFQMKVLLPAEADSAALGAALQAAAIVEGATVAGYVAAHPLPSLGQVVTPKTEHKQAYEAALRLFEQMGAHLFAR